MCRKDRTGSVAALGCHVCRTSYSSCLNSSWHKLVQWFAAPYFRESPTWWFETLLSIQEDQQKKLERLIARKFNTDIPTPISPPGIARNLLARITELQSAMFAWSEASRHTTGESRATHKIPLFWYAELLAFQNEYWRIRWIGLAKGIFFCTGILSSGLVAIGGVNSGVWLKHWNQFLCISVQSGSSVSPCRAGLFLVAA